MSYTRSHMPDPYDALIPVFLETKLPQRLRQMGTAVFVELHGEPFLLTAAHVIDERKYGELLVPTSEGLSPIDGYLACIDLPPEISRSEDKIDVAYYRLSLEFAAKLCHHFMPMPQNRCELVFNSLNQTICSVSGYPASKSGKNNEGAYSSEIFSFRGVAAAKSTYYELSLSQDQNIVIRFNKKRAVGHEGAGPFPTPGLKGISGGGIFAWPNEEEISQDWSLPKLVGLIHTFKEKEGLIIGTTLLPILSAIELERMKRFGSI